MGFMHDQLADGRGIRLLDVIDYVNQEGLEIELDFSLPSECFIRYWTGSLNGVANQTLSAAIKIQSTSAKRRLPGPRDVESASISSSQVGAHQNA